MDLIIQIQSLLVSLVFGICFSYLVRMQYKYLFESKLYIKISLTFLLVLDCFLLYFLVLRIINDGIFNYYFGIMLVIGYILGYKLIKVDRKM